MSKLLFFLCFIVLKCEAFRLSSLKSAVMDIKASFRGVQPFESVATLLFSVQKSSTSLQMTISENENEKVHDAQIICRSEAVQRWNIDIMTANSYSQLVTEHIVT